MDPQDKKVALRAITYGLYVMTSQAGDLVGGGGVNWLTQTSFDPPLLTAAVKADSGLCAAIEAGGTFAVNVTGCFAIGLLAQLAESRGVPSGQARTFLFVGVLGGYTTFSAFGNETIGLLRGGEALAAAANAGGQVALGLLAVVLGRAAAQLLWR